MKRPVFWAVVWFALGEVLMIAVEGWMKLAFAFIVLAVTLGLVFGKYVKKSYCMILFLMFALGVLRVACEPKDLLGSKKEFEYQDFVCGTGTVTKIKNSNAVVSIEYTILENSASCLKGYSTQKYNILVYDMEQYKIGQRVEIKGTLNMFEPPDNPGCFDMSGYYKSKKILYYMFSPDIRLIDERYNVFAELLRNIQNNSVRQLNKLCGENEAALYSAILMGDKSGIQAECKKTFQMAGISHILAISALHISLVGGLIFKLLRKTGVNYFVSGFAACMIAVIYGYMTGFSVSTIRAVIMMIIYIISQMFGRPYDLPTSGTLALIIILIVNPFYMLDGGMVLSFAAILGVWMGNYLSKKIDKMKIFYKSEEKKINITGGGIFNKPQSRDLNKTESRKLNKKGRGILYRPECRLFKNVSLFKKLISSFIMSTSIQAVTFPILLYQYYEFQMYSILVNVVVVPLMTFVVVFGFAGLISSYASISLGRIIIFPGVVILKLYLLICDSLLKLPFSVVNTGRPHIISIVIYYVVILVMLFLTTQKAKEICSVILYKFLKLSVTRAKIHTIKICIFAFVVLSFVTYNVSVYYLKFDSVFISMSVGQGDAFVLRSRGKTVMVVDGGSTSENNVGEYVIMPVLKYNAMANIDYWFVSHTDEDHINGLLYILSLGKLSGINIKNIVISPRTAEDEMYYQLLEYARMADINILYMDAGDMISDGTFNITCCHPDRKYDSSDKNQLSMILSYVEDDGKILFTGDADETALDYMVDTHPSLLEQHYDYLKVPHHGSKNSISKSLYEKMEFDKAIVSVGEKNIYGHPHRETLEFLEKTGIKLYRTDECGAVEVLFKNKDEVITELGN